MTMLTPTAARPTIALAPREAMPRARRGNARIVLAAMSAPAPAWHAVSVILTAPVDVRTDRDAPARLLTGTPGVLYPRHGSAWPLAVAGRVFSVDPATLDTAARSGGVRVLTITRHDGTTDAID